MHQPNKLKLAHHINKFLSNYSRSSPIDGVSTIPVIASVRELNCHTVHTEFCLNILVVDVRDLDNSILENVIRHLKVHIKYILRSV
jgi:hypothetical protein